MTRALSYLVWLALALMSGCQCSGPPVNDTQRKEGEPCQTDEQCETSLCDKLPGQMPVCFRRCATGCTAFEVCTSLQLNDRFVCVPERPASTPRGTAS